MAPIIALVAEDDDLWCCDEEFLCGNCGASAAEAVKDVVDVIEVLLNEFVDAGVVGNGVVAAARDLIARCQTFDTTVINKGPCDVEDLWLEHKGDIIVKNGDHVGSALQKVCKANHANWGLDHCEVPGHNIYGVVVIADKEVKHAVARSTGHTFDELVHKWGHSGILDGDSIEWLEVVHEVQHAGLLLDAEPVGAV